jgi:hypothetical protein
VLFRLHALRTTDLAHARLETLRLKLFKVGARFKSTARHLWFHLSSSWPGRDLFVEIWQKLKRLPSLRPVKLASLRLTLQPESKHSQQSDAGVFSQNVLFSRSTSEPTTSALLAWKLTFGSKALSNQCDFFNRILKTMNNAG